MDLRSLESFVRVSDLGSLTKASVALGVTQPSLSRVIGRLEREIGGPLFHRTGRGVSLTDLGESALPRARALIVEAEQLSADMRDLGRAPSGAVTLGILPSMMSPLAARLFDDLRSRLPGIRLRIFEGFSEQIGQWVAEGRVDIGLLSRYRAIRSDMDDVLLTSRLLLVGPGAPHALPAKTEFRRLASLPLVLPASPNGLRVLLDDTARKQGLRLNIVLEADSLDAQKAVVRRCACYALLSSQAIFEEQSSGTLSASRIVKPELTRLVVVTTSTQRPLSRAGREVLRTVRQIVAELVDGRNQFAPPAARGASASLSPQTSGNSAMNRKPSA